MNPNKYEQLYNQLIETDNLEKFIKHLDEIILNKKKKKKKIARFLNI